MSVRIASPNPAVCAACYQAQPEARHVDFEASTDGPIIVDEETGTVRVFPGGDTASVEEIVLCESCVRAGYLELARDGDVTDLEDARARLAAAEVDRDLWRARAENLRVSASEWGATPDWDKTGGGKKERAPVPLELRELALAAIEHGTPVRKAAEAIGVTEQAVRYWLRKDKAVA